MHHIYAARFDVMENLKNFLELNKASARQAGRQAPRARGGQPFGWAYHDGPRGAAGCHGAWAAGTGNAERQMAGWLAGWATWSLLGLGLGPRRFPVVFYRLVAPHADKLRFLVVTPLQRAACPQAPDPRPQQRAWLPSWISWAAWGPFNGSVLFFGSWVLTFDSSSTRPYFYREFSFMREAKNR